MAGRRSITSESLKLVRDAARRGETLPFVPSQPPLKPGQQPLEAHRGSRDSVTKNRGMAGTQFVFDILARIKARR